MLFYILLIPAALLGGCLGAAISHVPGKRHSAVLRALLLVAAAGSLFAGGLCLLARTVSRTAVVDRFFPDRLSKLAGCGILLLLCCGLGFLLGVVRAGGLRRYFRAASDSRLNRRGALGAAAAAFALAIGCAALAGDPPPSPLRLSEVCCANDSLVPDPDMEKFSDYIELVNTGSKPVNLSGYYLSDNPKKRSRFRLPAQTVGPGEYVILWADDTGKSGTRGGKDIHLNFSLKSGETVWFSSPHGILLDHVTIREGDSDVSESRQGEDWNLVLGTPGYSNDGAKPPIPVTLQTPGLSLASGFYGEDQILTLTAAPGCEIRYTLDGSAPTPESSLYTGPLTLTDRSAEPNRVVNQKNTTVKRDEFVAEPVKKATVVRAAAFRGGSERSETVTGTYFIGDFSEYAGQATLSLTVDPEDLFGPNGIAVTGASYDAWLDAGGVGTAPKPNFQQHGRAWERRAVVQLWDADRHSVLDQNCGVRVQGNTSRSYGVKRFSIYARKIYGGSSVFDAALFGGFAAHSYSTRDGIFHGFVQFYDFFAQQLISDRDLGTLDAMIVTLFVNGEYYETAVLRERYDRQYFAAHYGVDREDLAVISDNELDYGTEEDYRDYLDLIDYICTHDAADPEVWAEIGRRMDVQSCLDFLCSNFYCNNIDWCLEKNCKLWRCRGGGGEGVLDGRWRFLAYDMDAVGWADIAVGTAPAAVDPFQRRLPGGPAGSDRPIYREMPLIQALLRSPEFKTRFIQTYLDLMNVNFRYERAEPLLEKYGLTEHLLWPRFLQNRPAYALDNLIRALELGGEGCTLTLCVSSPEGGRIRMNTVDPDLSSGTWTGAWITGCPVDLTAVPSPGWRFAGWQGAEGAEAAITLSPEGDLAVTAVFEKIP